MDEQVLADTIDNMLVAHSDEPGMINLTDGILDVAAAIRHGCDRLGIGNAESKGWGAIELHSQAISEGCDKIAISADGIAEAITALAMAVDRLASRAP